MNVLTAVTVVSYHEEDQDPQTLQIRDDSHAQHVWHKQTRRAKERDVVRISQTSWVLINNLCEHRLYIVVDGVRIGIDRPRFFAAMLPPGEYPLELHIEHTTKFSVTTVTEVPHD
jgi:hypothetical protein